MTDAKAKAMKPKPDVEETAAQAASAASSAPTAAADGQSITKDHAAGLEGTVASEAQETTEKDEKHRALIQERKAIEKHEKERIREISKKIKKNIRENKRTKRREHSEDLGKSQRIKSVKKRILIPEVKNKEGETVKPSRRDRESLTFLRNSLKICTKTKKITLEEEWSCALKRTEKSKSKTIP